MKILIVGSFGIPGAGEPDPTFRASCASLGREIAQRGWTLVVGGNDPGDADRWVLQGANDVGCEVLLYSPDDPAAGGGSAATHQQRHPGPLALLEEVVTVYAKLKPRLLPPVRGAWDVGYALAITRADCLMMLGGRQGVRLAGQLATALLKPVIAIPSFGGTAQEEWHRQSERYRSLIDRGSITEEMINDVRQPSSPRFCSAAMDMVEAIVRDSSTGPGVRRRKLWLIGAVALCSIIWFAIFLIVPSDLQKEVQKTVTFVGPWGRAKLALLLWLSTFTGVIFRAVRRHVQTANDLLSVDILSTDILLGLVLSFAYIALCFAGAGIFKQDPLQLTVEDISRIGLILSVGGFAIGAFLDESAEYLSDKILRKFKS